jgi:hypothetical protein
MMAEIVEDYVVGQYLTLVGNHPEVELVETLSNPGTTAELADLAAAINETTDRLRERGADRHALLSRLDLLQARAEELRSIPATVTVSTHRTGRTYREALEAEQDTDSRRRVLVRAIDHVTISRLPEGHARRGNHAAVRVRINWNDEPEASA